MWGKNWYTCTIKKQKNTYSLSSHRASVTLLESAKMRIKNQNSNTYFGPSCDKSALIRWSWISISKNTQIFWLENASKRSKYEFDHDMSCVLGGGNCRNCLTERANIRKCSIIHKILPQLFAWCVILAMAGVRKQRCGLLNLLRTPSSRRGKQWLFNLWKLTSKKADLIASMVSKSGRITLWLLTVELFVAIFTCSKPILHVAVLIKRQIYLICVQMINHFRMRVGFCMKSHSWRRW